jgi:hypothetical protein
MTSAGGLALDASAIICSLETVDQNVKGESTVQNELVLEDRRTFFFWFERLQRTIFFQFRLCGLARDMVSS